MTIFGMPFFGFALACPRSVGEARMVVGTGLDQGVEIAGNSSLREEILEYIGPNAAKFMPTYDWIEKRKHQGMRKPVFPPITFVILAFFLGPVWFFYRKLWGWGLGLIGAGLIFALLPESWHFGAVGASLNLIPVFSGRQIYVTAARRNVLKLRARGPVDAAALRQAGGVSLPAAWISSAIILAIFAFSAFAVYRSLEDAQTTATPAPTDSQPLPSAAVAAPAPTPAPADEHNYSVHEGDSYGYTEALSDTDKANGKGLAEIKMVKFLGNEGGVYKLQAGPVVASCANPCVVVKVLAVGSDDDTEAAHYAFNPQTIIGAAFEDAFSGKLEVSQPTPAAPTNSDETGNSDQP